ncbi:MAG: DUF6754 domain-containing protein [Candidatus Latescibacterota bacterium]
MHVLLRSLLHGVVLGAAVAAGVPALAQPAPAVAPPSGLVAADHPMDGGEQVDLRWELSPDDPTPWIEAPLDRAGVPTVDLLPEAVQAQVAAARTRLSGYRVYRSLTAEEIRRADAAAVAEARRAAQERVTQERLRELGVEAGGVHQLSAAQKAELQHQRREAAAAAQAAALAQVARLAGQTRFAFAGIALPGESEFTVDRLDRQEAYLFRVEAVTEAGAASAPVSTQAPVGPVRQWFDGTRFWLLVIVGVLCGAVVFWIRHARSGRPIRVRQIAGLEAVDEAVGRATEMGRTVLFVPGIQDMNDIQTIAGLTVLARVARTAAEYHAQVEVPTSRSLVMTAARETVQASFLAAGRPDAYNPDRIYYVTDEQFGYVAFLAGLVVRERPAACFYMGSFFAESLILAETGNSIGAIQVAGTAQPAQLPFFVAACDYTLIGEEFFAASAYLSGSPEELGSLKGQDLGKLIVAASMVVGILLLTLGVVLRSPRLQAIAEYVRNTMFT